MKICFWSTTFQSDNHALADYLSRTSGWDVTVAVPNADAFRREPVTSLLPFAGRLLERDASETKRILSQEDFDLVVVDNHLPSQLPASHLLVLWHGFGWRVDDVSKMRSELNRLLGGAPSTPNFVWQAFGDWDREYRIRHSGFAPENVVALGSAYSDWLIPDSKIRREFKKTDQQAHYTIDLAKPVVMIGLTWHHGGSLGHWGEEKKLLERLVDHIARRGGSTLLRMHDRHRYTEDYQRLVTRLADERPSDLQLKWKSTSPDSLLDVLVSDVCISNYSSLLNAFYYTERPTIHIDPHDAQAAKQATFTMFLGRPMRREVASPEQLWKLPPDEHGGLRAQSFDELLAHVDQSLADPACCRERARDFVSRYVTQVDGATCSRMAAFLEQWLHTT